jgi:SAM-dependent methyltransferase
MFSGLRLVLCSVCELVFVDPMPSAEQLYAYNRSYFKNAHDGLPTDRATMLFLSDIARLRLRHVRSYLTEWQLSPGSVLEIGPGRGSFCENYLAENPAIKYVVVESDGASQAHLRELGAEVFSNLEEMAQMERQFDLLIMSHVLEHVSTPLEFLRNAVGLLNPGGAIFIEVPCRDYEFKDVLEPHLLFFDKLSMQKMLDRLDLTDIRLSYHGKDINRLKRESVGWYKLAIKIHRLLRGIGFSSTLSVSSPELVLSGDPSIESAAMNLEAHLTKDEPASWLRALARKPLQ